ncbi:hypothetical protein [Deinococcus arenicola]|uniref:hypothetical protein n=1 Tax=Deinococcus arenicola TaxID=2994950 RepID=UPI0029552D74|nr:hypothetical protein [Deinococcus sp. ZS9-10]
MRELGEYRLNVRGGQVQATGPSGQTRLLDRNGFMAVFGSYVFGPATSTGEMTDLGPLFG